ncbi:hypothetical protein ACWIVU_08685 [Ursidibacter arcticus]
MKKILSILSLSFILSGCFDEPKKEMASTTPAEKSEKAVDSSEKVTTSIENVVEKNQTTEITSAKDEKEVAQSNDKESKISENTVKSEDPVVENKPINTENSKNISLNTHSKGNIQPSESGKEVAEDTTNSLQSKEAVEQQQNAVDKQNKVSKKIQENKSTREITLSDEEKRVGYQKVLSDKEIEYLKSKCQYHLMSEKELKEYNCMVKKVIIAQ